MKNLKSISILSISLFLTMVLSGCTNDDITMECYEDDSGDLRTDCATMKREDLRNNISLEPIDYDLL